MDLRRIATCLSTLVAALVVALLGHRRRGPGASAAADARGRPAQRRHQRALMRNGSPARRWRRGGEHSSRGSQLPASARPPPRRIDAGMAVLDVR